MSYWFIWDWRILCSEKSILRRLQVIWQQAVSQAVWLCFAPAILEWLNIRIALKMLCFLYKVFHVPHLWSCCEITHHRLNPRIIGKCNFFTFPSCFLLSFIWGLYRLMKIFNIQGLSSHPSHSTISEAWDLFRVCSAARGKNIVHKLSSGTIRTNILASFWAFSNSAWMQAL